MNLGLEGTRVLVTAGASGIGLATARAFQAEGARSMSATSIRHRSQRWQAAIPASAVRSATSPTPRLSIVCSKQLPRVSAASTCL
jgi:NAD(P)-dependent dehydrogenase (short-subunit alcohol dehydrogenase family)